MSEHYALTERTVVDLEPLPLSTAVESLREGLEELKPLLSVHYAELSGHRERGYELQPNYREYLMRDDCGQVMYATLREGRRLVGYYVGFVTRCLHYGVLTLSSDIFYVMPTARGLAGGRMLLRCVEVEASRRGVDPSRMGFKTAHVKHMKSLLAAEGYGPFEETWVKWLSPSSDSEEV